MKRNLVFVIFVLFFLPLGVQGQVVDLSNVGPGDTIDSSTLVPAGAVINLNGGTIATNTDFDEVTLNVNSGVVGIDIDIRNSRINISGGEVSLLASDLRTGVNNWSNVISITGGEVGSFFQLRGNTTLALAGGSLEGFGTINNARAIVTGGSFNLVDVNSPIDIFGGDFNTFRVFSTGTVNLFGTSFEIDGVGITGLEVGQTEVITQRNVVLSGTLTDGETFSNFLDADSAIGSLNFSPAFGQILPGFASRAATVTVTLLPGAVPFVLGDCDQDGDVDFTDIVPFIDVLSLDGFLEQADCNRDGDVNFLDVPRFIEILINR